MAVAALVTWIITAAGGLYMLSVWVSKGGPTQRRGETKLAPPLIFGHFGLAALGLVVWIIYVATGSQALAWVAFVLLIPVALLGFVMFSRWLPIYRGATVGAGGAGSAAAEPPERHFPVAAVGAHGVVAVVTVVLVLLAALGA